MTLIAGSPLESMAPRPTKSDIPGLTAWRGLAAIWVMMFHLIGQYDMQHGRALSGLASKGYICVDFFFVLSGFVMTYVYRDLFLDRFSFGNYRKFLFRRIGRIYPAYFFVLTCLNVYTLLIFHGFANARPPGIESNHPAFQEIINYFLLQNWLGTNSFIGTAWSLSTEMAAYVFFPLLLMLGSLRNRAAIIGFSAFLVLIVVPLAETAAGINHYQGFLSLVRCFAEFTMGILAFRLFGLGASRLALLSSDGGLALVIIAALLLLAIDVNDGLVVLSFPIIIVGTALNRGKFARFLGTGFMQWLGLISYSVYLLHRPFQPIAQLLLGLFPHPTGIDAGLSIGLTALLIVAAAHLIYHFVEVPGRALIRSLSERRRMIRTTALSSLPQETS